MSGMMNTLFTSTHTPLYSATWTPSNRGQYAGTCIFIIVLATIFRALFSYRSIQEHRWRDLELKRRPVIVPGKKQDDDAARPDQKDIGAGTRKWIRSRPWRISTDGPRALLDTVIAAVGYLLSVAPQDLKSCLLIVLQHVGCDDQQRRLFPFCTWWHIPGQRIIRTLWSPLRTIAVRYSRLVSSRLDICFFEHLSFNWYRSGVVVLKLRRRTLRYKQASWP